MRNDEHFTHDPDPPQVYVRAKTILELQHGPGWKIYRHDNEEDNRWICRYLSSDDLWGRREALLVSLGEDGYVGVQASIIGSWGVPMRNLKWSGGGIGYAEGKGIEMAGILMTEALEEWRGRVIEGLQRRRCPKKFFFASEEYVRKSLQWAQKSLEEKEEIRNERRKKRQAPSRQLSLF